MKLFNYGDIINKILLVGNISLKNDFCKNIRWLTQNINKYSIIFYNKKELSLLENSINFLSENDMILFSFYFYIIFDIPYSVKEHLYPLCSLNFTKLNTIFENNNIQKEKTLYHVREKNYCQDITWRQNGFLSTSSKKGVSVFAKYFNEPVFFNVDQSYSLEIYSVCSLLNQPIMIDFIDRYKLKFSSTILKRISEEDEYIVLFSSEEASSLLTFSNNWT